MDYEAQERLRNKEPVIDFCPRCGEGDLTEEPEE